MRALIIVLTLFIISTCMGATLAADCEVYGLSLKIGESKTTPGKCSLVQCNGKGSDQFDIKVCPNAYAPAHCKFVPVNLNKAYPDCCPHWDC